MAGKDSGCAQALMTMRDALLVVVQRTRTLIGAVEALELWMGEPEAIDPAAYDAPTLLATEGRTLDPAWADNAPDEDRWHRRQAIDATIALRVAIRDAIDAVPSIAALMDEGQSFDRPWRDRTFDALRGVLGAITHGHRFAGSALPMIRTGVPAALKDAMGHVEGRMEDVQAAIRVGIANRQRNGGANGGRILGWVDRSPVEEEGSWPDRSRDRLSLCLAVEELVREHRAWFKEQLRAYSLLEPTQQATSLDSTSGKATTCAVFRLLEVAHDGGIAVEDLLPEGLVFGGPNWTPGDDPSAADGFLSDCKKWLACVRAAIGAGNARPPEVTATPEHPALTLFGALNGLHVTCSNAGAFRLLADTRRKKEEAREQILNLRANAANARSRAGADAAEVAREFAQLDKLATSPPTPELTESMEPLRRGLATGREWCERARAALRAGGAKGLDAATQPNAAGQARSIELHTRLGELERAFVGLEVGLADPRIIILKEVERMADLGVWFGRTRDELRAVIELRGVDNDGEAVGGVPDKYGKSRPEPGTDATHPLCSSHPYTDPEWALMDGLAAMGAVLSQPGLFREHRERGSQLDGKPRNCVEDWRAWSNFTMRALRAGGANRLDAMSAPAGPPPSIEIGVRSTEADQVCKRLEQAESQGDVEEAARLAKFFQAKRAELLIARDFGHKWSQSQPKRDAPEVSRADSQTSLGAEPDSRTRWDRMESKVDDLAGVVKSLAARDDNDTPTVKLPTLKPWAFEAWKANQAGMTTTAIAATLAKKHNDPRITQPRVSEQIQRARLHAEASGLAVDAAKVMPQVGSRAPARTLDPAAVEQGKRTDGKAHHLRERERQKAKDGDDEE